MTLFSERYGYTKPREAFQIGEIDEPLRNGLWNVLDIEIFYNLKEYILNKYIEKVWSEFRKKTIDSIPLIGF